jgi:hypothetical protein
VIVTRYDGHLDLDDESPHRDEDYGKTVRLLVWRSDGNKSLDDF